MATSLNRFTAKKPCVCGQKQQDAFSNLKVALITTPVLALPNSKDLFILDTNASDFAIGAELMHVQEGRERVIAYGSFSLTPEQQRYCSQEKSCLQSYVSPRNAIIIFLAENLWLGGPITGA